MLSVAWAPDGVRLAVGGGEDFRGYTNEDVGGAVVTHQVAAIVEAASGEVVREVPHGRSVWSLAWSPDGALLALGGCKDFGSRDGKVSLVDAASGEVLREVLYDLMVRSVAWSPNGAQLAVGRGNEASGGYVQIFDATSGDASVELKVTQQREVACVAWSPDGSFVAEAGGDDTVDTEVKLIDAASGAVQLEILRNVEFTATWSVAWSSDGSRLAVCGHPRAKELQVAIVDTREVTARGWLGGCQVTPQHRRICFQYKQAVLRRVLDTPPDGGGHT